MNIDLGKYVITSDNLQYILNERQERGDRSKKQGEEYLKPIGYYTELAHLIPALIELRLRKSEAESLKELARDMADLKEWAAISVKGLKWDMKREEGA